MSTYVFLGPSLPREHAAKLLEATYLPPLQQGDLIRLLERKPRYVGIIDGYFETVPAVWHKEILLAMEQGVHVLGSASMGALRAAELHELGMIGIGTIFEWYRDGKVVADDEVAVRHAPADLEYLPLNIPLVDIRDSCHEAVREGVVDGETAAQIVEAARRLPFWERNNEYVADAVCHALPQLKDAARNWLAFATSRYVSLKRRDAIALLEELKRMSEAPWQPKRLSFRVEPTIFIERLLNEIKLEAVQRVLGRHGSDNRQLVEQSRRTALLRALAREAARQSGWNVGKTELAEQANALWAEIGLAGREAIEDWMQRNALSDQAVMSHIEDELYVGRLMRKFAIEVDRALPEQILLTRAIDSDASDSSIHASEAREPE